MKTRIATMCHNETKRLRRQQTTEERMLASQQFTLQNLINTGQGTATTYQELQDVSTKLRQAKGASFSLHTTLEKIAYDMGQKHDISSAAFYRQWTPRNDAQWIAEIITADWSDPSQPVLKGSEKRAAHIARARSRRTTRRFSRRSRTIAAANVRRCAR